MKSHFPAWKWAFPALISAWTLTMMSSSAENSPAELEEEIEFVGPPEPSLLPRDAMLELPEWKPEDSRELEANQAPANLGGGLWPAEVWPLMPMPRPLPRMAKPPPQPLLTEADSGLLKPLSAELNAAYFSTPPDSILVDPQGLLDEFQHRDITQFVHEYATKSAGAQVRLLILSNEQKLADTTAMQEITDRWFPEQRAVVVVYSMGRPKSSLCYFSKNYQAAYPIDKFVGLRDACVKEALIAEMPDQQFARYAVKLALRINTLTAPSQITQSQPAVHVVRSRSGLAGWWQGSVAAKLLSILLAVFSLLLTGWVWMTQRKRKFLRVAAGKTWMLPDQEMTTRLSAPHCGGTMAVVKFK